MANYIHYDYNQNQMLAINLQDQLQADLLNMPYII